MIPQIFLHQCISNLRNRFLIGVIRDFWVFRKSQISELTKHLVSFNFTHDDKKGFDPTFLLAH